MDLLFSFVRALRFPDEVHHGIHLSPRHNQGYRIDQPTSQCPEEKVHVRSSIDRQKFVGDNWYK